MMDKLDKIVFRFTVNPQIGMANKFVGLNKIEAANAAKVGEDAWKGTVTKQNPAGDLNVGTDAIDAIPDMTEDEKNKAKSAMRVNVTNRRAEAAIQLEAQQEEDLDGINKLMYGDMPDYDAANKAIEASSLSEANQASLLATSRRNAALKQAGAAGSVPL